MTQTSQVNLWGRQSLGRKLAVIPGIFVIAIALMMIHTLVTMQSIKPDSLAMDFIGRQRTLNQRYFTRVLLAHSGADVNYGAAAKLLTQSADALIHGGRVAESLESQETVQVPPAPTEAIRARLTEQKTDMAKFEQAAQRFLAMPRSDPRSKTMLENLRRENLAIQDLCNDAVKRYQSYSERKIEHMEQWQLVVGLLLMFCTGVVAWRIGRGVVVPVERLSLLAQRIAEGDLQMDGAEVHSADEIGRLTEAFNHMLVSMKEMTSRTRTATANLMSASAEILASCQEQSASTREQAAAVHQTTSTMQEVSQASNQISEKAKQVAAAAEATATTTEAGLKAVAEVTQMINGIMEQAEAVAENIVGLSEKTQAIGDIISSVNDIAEQSNLLALNASLEAAAAGDHGRRFGVVAHEMKNLAGQSKDATVQVAALLGAIQKGINGSVLLTEEAVKRVDAGKTRTEVTARTIQQMAGNIEQSVQAFQQIVAGTNQQLIGFEQVTQALQDIRQASEQSAAGTSQLEKAAANLNALSQQLEKAVERFRT